MAAPRSFLYFAYGSNLLRDRIQINNPSATFKAPARLPGYRLEFNYRSLRWNGAVATIEEDPQAELWGVLWEIDYINLPCLDLQEGVHLGIYKALSVQVETQDGTKHECRCYQMTQPWETDRRPSQVYKSVMIRGAQESGIPSHYITHLESIEHNGYDGPVDVLIDLQKKLPS